MIPGAGFLAAVESLENKGKVFLRDSVSGVSEDNLKFTWQTFREHPYVSALRCVLPGILKKVCQNLGELLRVSHHLTVNFRNVVFDGNLSFSESRLKKI